MARCTGAECNGWCARRNTACNPAWRELYLSVYAERCWNLWFHPHVNAAEQAERGLHGVLIVEDPEAPVYTQDLAWVLDDWLFSKAGEIYDQFVTRHDLAHDGRWGTC